MVLNITMRIEYLNIFAANVGNRLLEQRRQQLIERDHHFGVIRFEVSEEEVKFLKESGIEFIQIESECPHDYKVYKEAKYACECYCAGCGAFLSTGIDPQGI